MPVVIEFSKCTGDLSKCEYELIIFREESSMLIKSIQMQYKIITEKKNYYFMMLAVFCFVLLNYFSNVFKYAGMDILDMYQPMRLLLLSNSGIYYRFFALLYPIIVLVPAAFSFMFDQDVNEQVFIQTRTDVRNYYLGKTVATFIVTFNVFTIPLLVEIFLNSIAFPFNATGLLSNQSIYDEVSLHLLQKLLLPSIYAYSPIVYSIIFIVIFGIFSGIIACFALSLSMLFNFKFKAFLFLPTYAFSYILNAIQYVIPNFEFTTNYYNYFDMFDGLKKSLLGYIALALCIAIITLILVVHKSRKDSL